MKETGKVLSEDLFAAPVWSDSLFSMHFDPVSSKPPTVEVVDERPARLILREKRNDGLYGTTDVSLWTGLDYVDVSQEMDLEALPETNIVQDYSLAFGFDMSDAQVEIDAAGGFLDPSRDRFPGIDHDAYAVRRGVSLTDGKTSIDWISLDGRVVRVRNDQHGKPVIYANLIEQLPRELEPLGGEEGRADLPLCRSRTKGRLRRQRCGPFRLGAYRAGGGTLHVAAIGAARKVIPDGRWNKRCAAFDAPMR